MAGTALKVRTRQASKRRVKSSPAATPCFHRGSSFFPRRKRDSQQRRRGTEAQRSASLFDHPGMSKGVRRRRSEETDEHETQYGVADVCGSADEVLIGSEWGAHERQKGRAGAERKLWGCRACCECVRVLRG